jgi:hypothetical protein
MNDVSNVNKYTRDKNVVIDNSNKQNETLIALDVMMHDVIFKTVGSNVHRIIPLSNNENKNYYFMTDFFDPGYVRCNIKTSHICDIFTGQKYNVNFTLNDKSYDDRKKETDDNNNNDIITQTRNTINRLNSFKKGLIDRIKFLMQVPENLSDQSMYYMNVNMIKIGNDKKLRNIIEYNDVINNMSVSSMITILKYCRCKLLFQINSLDLLQKGAYLNIRLVRVYPEIIDLIPDDKKMYVLSELSSSNIRSIVHNNTMHSIAKTNPVSKYCVRDELKRLLLV